MKRFLYLSAAGGAVAWLFRRRSQREQPEAAYSAPPPVEHEPPGYAHERGAVAGQGERERESEATDETRYERLRDAESEERGETAERLASEPPPQPRDDES